MSLEAVRTKDALMVNSQLHFARKLLIETNLSLQDIMLACDFYDANNFYDAYKKRFRCHPAETKRKPLSQHSIILSVPYLKPYDFEWIMQSYRNHQIGNLEWFEDEKMFRLINFGESTGVINIANNDKKSQLVLEIDFPDVRYYKTIYDRVSKMFDVDCDPILLEETFKKSKEIRKIFKKYPGVRIANGWEPFEIAIATILGQLVSVKRAQALISDLIELLGEPTSIVRANKTIKKFPLPETIATADLSSLKTTGIRKKTLTEFSKAYLNKSILLDSDQHIEAFMENMLKIFGIGLWTANYVALKALKYHDAFPASDLFIARAIKLFAEGTFELMQPFRGYVAMLLWREYAVALSKQRAKKLSTRLES